jgi:SnoaL-like polyketide cyclase
VTGRADSERYMNVARRWFAEGRAGNVALADDLFSGNVRTNGVPVGVAGPKRRIQQRLAACPDLTTTIEDMLSAHDNIVRGLSGTERIPAHMGRQGYGQADGGPRLRRLAFRSWQGGGEISTIQDQFGLPKQIGYFPDGGLCGVACARPAAGGGTRQAGHTMRRGGRGPVLTSQVLSPCRLSG